MTVFEVIFPVIAIASVGYLAAYFKLLQAAEIEGISRFVFTIALPVLLFHSLATLTLPDSINWQFVISYYAVAVIIYALGVWMSRRWFLQSPQQQGVFGLGASYSNLMLVGLPIISSGLGEKALLPLFMIVSVHSAILFFIVTLLVERANGTAGSLGMIATQTLRGLARNPIIIALALGLIVNLTRVSLPKPLDDALNILGDAALPCALFVLGASLSAYKLAGHFAEAWAMVGLKMVLQPLMVWVLAFWVFHIDPLWGAVAVMAAGMPIGVNAFLFAQRYQVSIAPLSTAILLSTLLAVISQSVLLAFFI